MRAAALGPIAPARTSAAIASARRCPRTAPSCAPRRRHDVNLICRIIDLSGWRYVPRRTKRSQGSATLRHWEQPRSSIRSAFPWAERADAPAGPVAGRASTEAAFVGSRRLSPQRQQYERKSSGLQPASLKRSRIGGTRTPSSTRSASASHARQMDSESEVELADESGGSPGAPVGTGGSVGSGRAFRGGQTNGASTLRCAGTCVRAAAWASAAGSSSTRGKAEPWVLTARRAYVTDLYAPRAETAAGMAAKRRSAGAAQRASPTLVSFRHGGSLSPE